jgi:hypothetical protein
MALRVIATTAMVTGAVLLGASVPEAPPAPAPTPPTEMSTVAYTHNDDLPHMISWNMCNSAPTCPDTGDNKANALWGALQQNSVSPAAVGTQEICRAAVNSSSVTTYESLNAAFAYVGHQNNWYTTLNPGSNCSRVGVSIWWVGGCYNNDCRVDQVYDYQDSDPSDNETRANVCGRAAWPGFMACSTHLDKQAANVQAISEYTPFMVYMNANIPTFGLGDFNLHPASSALDSMYYYWRESDGCRSTTCWRNTWTGSSAPDTKLDFIWFPTPSHCREHDVQLINKAESDHHLMRAYPGTPPCPYLQT